jgi:hypothetical protein
MSLMDVSSSSVSTTPLTYDYNTPNGSIDEIFDGDYQPTVPFRLEKWRKVERLDTLLAWLLKSSHYTQHKDYSGMTVVDKYGVRRYFPKGDIYLVLWPKGGLGPEGMRVVDYYGAQVVNADFGLPLLMKLGIVEEEGRYKDIEMAGAFIDPRTGQHLLPLSLQDDGYDFVGISKRSDSSGVDFSVEMPSPFGLGDMTRFSTTKVKIHENVDIYAFKVPSSSTDEFGAVVHRMKGIYNVIDSVKSFGQNLREMQELLDTVPEDSPIPAEDLPRFNRLVAKYSQLANYLSNELSQY